MELAAPPPLDENLRELTLGLSYSLTDEDVFSFLAQLPLLERLQLQYYLQLRSPKITPRLARLKYLAVNYAPVSVRSEVIALCKWIKRLIAFSPIEHVRLLREDLGPDTAHIPFDSVLDHLVMKHAATLCILDLMHTYVTADGVRSVLERLAARSTLGPRPLKVTAEARHDKGDEKLRPQVVIISMFDPEAQVWYHIPEFNVLARNISVLGFSPLFPQAHCTKDGAICQITIGEGEINAATSITALLLSPSFDLTSTYFLISGIAGVNPKLATLNSVTFARFAVQVALQFEFDAREKPENFSTGYVPQGSRSPDEYPQSIYGTEVFELNDALRKLAVGFAKTAKLKDSLLSQSVRQKYATTPGFTAGTEAPSIVECDTATSDAFWTGALLGEAFENTTRLFTNGSATYCTTQQEDNATLESLLRGASHRLVDFSRIIVMRSASDFDRPFQGQSPADNLFGDAGAFDPSLENLHLAGVKVVEGITAGWSKTFKEGVKPKNYVGDIFGTLGGVPNFGPGSIFGGKPAVPSRSFRTVGY
ncbi:hypothetical protein H0H87_001230 [Tephrocybe sp. NHM501043]|nr:hypothetical protein H0H87_001230 [Tephrocybe sp. NHM501043]